MRVPETRFVQVDGLNIAYQVVGDGPIDLVHIPGFVSNVELAWEDPLLARFLERQAGFSRLILFDKRGTGMSDRVPSSQLPTLEQRMDVLVAVLDAVGSDQAALFGFSEGGSLAVLFAATYPERVRTLVTVGIFAKRVWSSDYPWAPTLEERARSIEQVERDWGGTSWLIDIAPSLADDEASLRQVASYCRRSASPGAAALLRMNTTIDVRGVVPLIQAPTLMLHRTGDRDANIEEGRWIASQIPNARFVELPGDDHLPWVGDAQTMLDLVEEFLTGTPPVRRVDRQLATLLFIDLVASTETAASLGDRAWRDLLDRHQTEVRRQLARYRGRELDTAGDGFWPVSTGLPVQSRRPSRFAT